MARAEGLVARLEALLPEPPRPPQWEGAIAYRWRSRNGRGWMQPVAHPHRIRLADLRGIDDQKKTIESLGFHHLNETKVLEDSLRVRGMITKVRHLLKVEEAKS